MNIKAFKTTGLSFALAAAFLVIAGAAGSSNTFAQDERGRDRERDGGQDNRSERDDLQDNRRERFEERRGFRDGLIRGREDALEGRRFNPSDITASALAAVITDKVSARGTPRHIAEPHTATVIETISTVTVATMTGGRTPAATKTGFRFPSRGPLSNRRAFLFYP